MEMSEICVAFPLQHQWQCLEELAAHNEKKQFIANPPPLPISYGDITPIQQLAVDMDYGERSEDSVSLRQSRVRQNRRRTENMRMLCWESASNGLYRQSGVSLQWSDASLDVWMVAQ